VVQVNLFCANKFSTQTVCLLACGPHCVLGRRRMNWPNGIELGGWQT